MNAPREWWRHVYADGSEYFHDRKDAFREDGLVEVVHVREVTNEQVYLKEDLEGCSSELFKLRAEIAREKEERHSHAEDADKNRDYILRLSKLLGCADGDDTPEARISDLIAEVNALRALSKLPDDYCLACGGTGGHYEGCAGTTGLIALIAERDEALKNINKLEAESVGHIGELGILRAERDKAKKV